MVGASFSAPRMMRFRRREGVVGAAPLPPRSVYLLAGAGRSDREHSIRAMDALRYSVTFRSAAHALPAGLELKTKGSPRSCATR